MAGGERQHKDDESREGGIGKGKRNEERGNRNDGTNCCGGGADGLNKEGRGGRRGGGGRGGGGGGGKEGEWSFTCRGRRGR